MSKLLQAVWWNWLLWTVGGALIWMAWGNPDPRILLGVEAFISVVWLVATRKERAFNRGWARRNREDDRRWQDERRQDNERFQQEMAAKQALEELVLRMTRSEEFAKEMKEKHWKEGVVHVFFLNPAGELRQLTAGQFLGQPFHPQDRPRVCVVRVGSSIRFSEETFDWYYDHYLRWDEVPLWRIVEWNVGCFILADAAGELFSVHLPGEPGKAVDVLLEFVSRYSSVADYTLQMIARFGIPVLRKSKVTSGSADLGRLRVALQIRERMFTTTGRCGLEVFEGLLERDPDQDQA